MKERLTKRIREDEANNIFKTFDSFFCEWNDNNIKHIKDKTVFIGEFRMVPNKFMTLLYRLWLKYNFKIFVWQSESM